MDNQYDTEVKLKRSRSKISRSGFIRTRLKALKVRFIFACSYDLASQLFIKLRYNQNMILHNRATEMWQEQKII